MTDLTNIQKFLKQRIKTLDKQILIKQELYDKYFDPDFPQFGRIFNRIPVSTFDIITKDSDPNLSKYTETLLEFRKNHINSTSFNRFIQIPVTERPDYIKKCKTANKFNPEATKKEKFQAETFLKMIKDSDITFNNNFKTNYLNLSTNCSKEYDYLFDESNFRYIQYSFKNTDWIQYYTYSNCYLLQDIKKYGAKISIKLVTYGFFSKKSLVFEKIIVKDGICLNNIEAKYLLSSEMKEIIKISDISDLPDEVKNYFILS